MRCLSVLLAGMLVLPFSLCAAGQDAGLKLNLVVAEGEGTIHNIRQRTAREPIVQVEDENHKPVAGAAVVFTLPSQGACGSLAGGQPTLTVMTDSQVRAVACGLHPNDMLGQNEIHVNASYNRQAAVVGSAAAGGALYATQSGGGNNTNTATIPAGVTRSRYGHGRTT